VGKFSKAPKQLKLMPLELLHDVGWNRRWLGVLETNWWHSVVALLKFFAAAART
jgi:hypothetical protein